MTQLAKVSSNIFNDVHVDFFKTDSGDIIMTAEQIGSSLGYSEGRKSILKIYERNIDVLEQYSDVVKLTATDGKEYDTRIFSEKGIYRIAFLSKKPRAIEFQEWVLDVIQQIRKTGIYITTTDVQVPELLQKVNELETKIESFITITSYEARILQKAINRRVYEVVKDQEQRSLGFQEIHREVRDRFGVPSYRDISKHDFQNALGYVKAWIPKKVTA